MSINREPPNGKVSATIQLTCGKDGNYHHFKKMMAVELQKILGDVANVMKTDKAHEIPAVSPADYTPPGEPLDAETTRLLRADCEKNRMKEVRELKKSCVLLYANLMSLMSPGSRDLVERHPDFAANDLAADPNVLWRIIRETHSTNTTGTGKEQVLSNKVLMQMEFNDLRQGKTSIIDFKELFMSKWKTLLSHGVHEVEEAELALMFLYRLDKTRYGQMIVDLANDALKGIPYPTTVMATYIMAANRQEYTASASSSTHTVYTLSEDKHSKYKPTSGRGTNPARGNGRFGRGSGRGGHTDTGRTGGRGPRAEVVTKPSAEEPIDTVHRRVHFKSKGHRASSPEVPKEAVCVVTNDIDCDEYADYDEFDMMFEETNASVLSFGPTEVLLDSQGGRSVFKAQSLLHDVSELEKPYTLGGIDASGVRGLRINHSGYFRDFEKLGCSVGCSTKASANVLSMAECVDRGYHVDYSSSKDEFTLHGDQMVYNFKRLVDSNGRKSKHYVANMVDYPSIDRPSVLVETVAENMVPYTKREIDSALNARRLQESRMGHMSSKALVDIINSGVQNCPVTAQDVLRADAIFGRSIAGIKGKTKKMASAIANIALTPRVTQVQQIMHVDLFFVKGIIFLLAKLQPLGLALIAHLKDKSTQTVKKAMDGFLDKIKSRNFDVQVVTSDGEGAIQLLTPHLNSRGIIVEPAAPGAHVPRAERSIQEIKGFARSFENSLPYVMSRTILTFCVLYCVSTMNLMIPTNGTLQVSPMEQFTGRKLDMKRDLSFGFGDYVQATVPNTNNTLQARTEGCIALLSKGNLTGSVYMYNIGTGSVCTRDQFKILPIPDVVITLLTDKATKQGFRRGAMDQGSLSANIHQADQLPNGMGIDQEIVDMRSQQADSIVDIAGVTDNTIRETVRESRNDFADDATPGLDDDEEADAEDVLDIPTDVATTVASPTVPSPAVPSPVSPNVIDADAIGGGGHRYGTRLAAGTIPNVIDADAIGGGGHRYGTRLAAGTIPYRGAPPSKLTLLAHDQNEDARREIRRQLELRQHWRDTTYAFTISVKMAMRDRGEEARPVIMAEIQQMVDKRVWHGVHLKNLSHEQRKRVIRSKMFLKDKYLASGAFDRFKARLVAGGDMQDKSLYEELSSPTAATSSVLAVAAIAAKEGRRVVTIDIGGAFLNAKMPDTGIKVHMRLDSMMTELLLKIDPSYAVFLEPRGTVVVELDKALYGCVEAAALWYDDLKKTIQRDGFEENPYDRCIFNKICKDGSQMTIALHVDDLMITNLHDENLDTFFEHLKRTYKETKIVRGQILDYVGMTFNFSVAGEVKITMENCVNEILADCGVTQVASTPASPMLFDIRDAEKASGDESKWFHSYTAKMLYLSKRARPECLTTVAFLTTRVNVCDKDDLGKLRRLLAYLRGTKERGIILRIGERMEVRTYIDAAYGVHTSSGKSHTGCVVVIGEGGPVYNKSSKQKIVTKSSTEAELVGLSDSVSQALHMRNFLVAQGYVIGPIIIHQDNMSCMALIKKGGPCSERSRHISIRYFWLCSKVESGEAIVVHLRTEMMFANVLTKPVQGSAFVNERGMLTNWK